MTTSVQPMSISVHPDGFAPSCPARKQDMHFDDCAVRPSRPPPGRGAAPDSFYTILLRCTSREGSAPKAGMAAGAGGSNPSSFTDAIRAYFSG
jgi:hypothetical protein